MPENERIDQQSVCLSGTYTGICLPTNGGGTLGTESAANAPATPLPSTATPTPTTTPNPPSTTPQTSAPRFSTSLSAVPDPIISVRGLTKTYSPDSDTPTLALEEIDVDFPRGQFTAIMGPSGSGKSSLLHCLAGLDSFDSGQVTVSGQDLSGLNAAELTRFRRETVGFIFQAFNLVPTLTVRENIELPSTLLRREIDSKRLARLLSDLDLEGRESSFPHQLSGGQQQKVACARALLSRPAVVFADEPTGNLDSLSSEQVLSFLRSAARDAKQSVVMVTHEPDAAQYADRVLFLWDGRIVAQLLHPTREAILEALRTLGAIRASLRRESARNLPSPALSPSNSEARPARSRSRRRAVAVADAPVEVAGVEVVEVASVKGTLESCEADTNSVISAVLSTPVSCSGASFPDLDADSNGAGEGLVTLDFKWPSLSQPDAAAAPEPVPAASPSGESIVDSSPDLVADLAVTPFSDSVTDSGPGPVITPQWNDVSSLAFPPVTAQNTREEDSATLFYPQLSTGSVDKVIALSQSEVDVASPASTEVQPSFADLVKPQFSADLTPSFVAPSAPVLQSEFSAEVPQLSLDSPQLSTSPVENSWSGESTPSELPQTRRKRRPAIDRAQAEVEGQAELLAMIERAEKLLAASSAAIDSAEEDLAQASNSQQSSPAVDSFGEAVPAESTAQDTGSRLGADAAQWEPSLPELPEYSPLGKENPQVANSAGENRRNYRGSYGDLDLPVQGATAEQEMLIARADAMLAQANSRQANLRDQLRRLAPETSTTSTQDFGDAYSPNQAETSQPEAPTAPPDLAPVDPTLPGFTGLNPVTATGIIPITPPFPQTPKA